MTIEEYSKNPQVKMDLISSMEVIRVLHIDDDDNQQMFLKIFVEGDKNIKMTSVQNLADIIQLVQTGAYDCIITDFDMPDVDGLTLASKVRAISNIPIIIYTGRGSEEIAEKAFSVGVDDYIRKEMSPAHYQIVAKRIRQAVERRRSNESYKSLFSNASDAIIIHTFDGSILDINEAGCRRLCNSKEGLLGSNLFQYVSRNEIDKKDTLRLLKMGRRTIFESMEKSRNGSIIPVEISAKVISFMGFEAVLSFSRDISERKRLENQMSKRLEVLQIHSLALSKCESISEVVKTTFQILHDDMGYSFFSLGIVEKGRIKFIPDTVFGKDWVMDYSLDGPGICGRSVKYGSTILIPDTRLDPDYFAPRTGYKYLSDMAVPVKIGGKVVAVINLEDEKKNRFTRDDAALLEVFSEHVGSALYRINLTKSAKQQLSRLEELNKFAKKLTSVNTIDEVTRNTFDIVEKTLSYGNVAVGFVESSRIRFISPQTKTEMKDVFLPLNGKGITIKVVNTGKTQLVPDTSQDPDFIASIRTEDTFSELDVPIKVDGKVVAVINLENREPDFFNEADKEVVEIIASHVGSALALIRKREKLALLHRYASKLSLSRDIDEVANHTLTTLKDVFNFNTCSFHLREGEEVKMIMTLGSILDRNFTQKLEGKGVIPFAMREGHSIYIPDVNHDEHYVRGMLPSEDIRSSEFVAPIIVDKKVLAAINIEDSQVDSFNLEDRELVETLAENVSLALSQIEKRRELLKAESLTRSIANSTQDMIWSVNAEDFSLLTFNESFSDYQFKEHGIQVQPGTSLKRTQRQ